MPMLNSSSGAIGLVLLPWRRLLPNRSCHKLLPTQPEWMKYKCTMHFIQIQTQIRMQMQIQKYWRTGAITSSFLPWNENEWNALPNLFPPLLGGVSGIIGGDHTDYQRAIISDNVDASKLKVWQQIDKARPIWFTSTSCISWLFLKQLFTSKSLIIAWSLILMQKDAYCTAPGAPQSSYTKYIISCSGSSITNWICLKSLKDVVFKIRRRIYVEQCWFPSDKVDNGGVATHSIGHNTFQCW